MSPTGDNRLSAIGRCASPTAVAMLGGMIEIQRLTKRYRQVTAVDDVSVTLRAGEVTCLLGPNGAGKTTTLRMVLGLTTPTSGDVLIAGRRYRDLDRPLTAVGHLLESCGAHRSRTAKAHLAWLAESNGIPRARIHAVLEAVGLENAAGRRVGAFSLGMRQRLGLAAALLGEPRALLLDEPGNGLDPAGVVWLRGVLRERADAGVAVVLSSHAMAEVAQVADRVVVIAGGRLLADGTVAELACGHASLEEAYFALLAAAPVDPARAGGDSHD